MIQDTSRFKMDLLGGLERVLHGKVKLMITQCSIRHLYSLPVPQSEKDPLILFAKSMERRRCNHHELENPLSTLECYSDIIDPKRSATNRHRYVVASQEEEVRRFCRGIKGVPIVYVKRSVMILEPMAEGSVGVKEGTERDKFRTGLRGRAGKRKRDEDEQPMDNIAAGDHEVAGVERSEDGDEPVKKKKRARGPKGPNPLSVKKSKREREKPEEIYEVTSPADPEDSGDGHNNETSIIERDPDRTQAPSGKRKRKRKHKPGKLDELRHEAGVANGLTA
ncbi:MAG: hypothetical protein Q9181_004921 [Wetmoreana brouardii]